VNKKSFLFAKRFLKQAFHPASGRPGYISPNLPQKFHFIQQKSEKKEREERKREEEAAKPCSHVDLEVYSYSSRIIT
jgi:hypothetical protein